MPRSKPRTRRLTRAEFYRMADLGFFRNRRVELINGAIVEMPVMKNPHAVAIALTEDALRKAFGPGFWVRTQMPVALGKWSEPEPDVAVVPGSPRDYSDHPTTALLVAEISDTTLSYDRNRKARLYARAGIPEYWIVNLVQNQLEVRRDPQPDPANPRRFRYTQTIILKAGDTIAPLAAPQALVAVADLLP